MLVACLCFHVDVLVPLVQLLAIIKEQFSAARPNSLKTENALSLNLNPTVPLRPIFHKVLSKLLIDFARAAIGCCLISYGVAVW